MSGVRPAAEWRAARRDPSLVVLEGLHALKHALRFGAEIVDAASPDPVAAAALAEALAPDVAPRIAALLRPVPPDVYARLAPRPHPTGAIALARRPAVDARTALVAPGPAPAVLLEGARAMGNLGAAVRVAAAAGAAALLALGRHDPWSPAAVRGAAGLQFALPVVRIAALPPTDRPLVAADPAGAPLEPGGLPPRALLAFGAERGGLSGGLLARADLRVAIPMRAGVSSLNLATAVAVLLYAGIAAPRDPALS